MDQAAELNMMTIRTLKLIGSLIASLGFANACAVELGQTAPSCSLATIGSSNAVDPAQLRGHVVYVDFWASWCPPCARAFPFMNALVKEFGDRGLRVVGINVDEDPRDAERFLGTHPAVFTVARDSSGKCPREFGVEAMPSSFLIDQDGVVRHIQLGFRPQDARDIHGHIEKLLLPSASSSAPSSTTVAAMPPSPKDAQGE